MSHGAFLISALCVLLHFLPRALGDTTLTGVCVEGDCASPKRSRSLIQKGKTSFQRGHNTNDIGKSGVRDEDALRLGEEEGQRRQDNQGLKDPDDEHPREGPKEKEKEDDFAGESLLQPRKATKDGNENQVYIGPNHYQAHETVCTEEPLGLYCDKDSGNPENRVNDRDTSHWSYPKERFRIYRSTAICVKKGHGEGWGHDIKITCQARKMGNWDQKAYWDKIHHNVHRYTGNYDPTEWETKELFVGANKEDKASMCIEEREGWTCNNEDNKDLTDQGFTIYRRNPICAWMDTTQYANRWTQKLKIECSAGIKGCGSTKLKKKKRNMASFENLGKRLRPQRRLRLHEELPQQIWITR